MIFFFPVISSPSSISFYVKMGILEKIQKIVAETGCSSEWAMAQLESNDDTERAIDIWNNSTKSSVNPNPQNEKSRGQTVSKPFKEDNLQSPDDSEAVEKAPERTPAGGGLLVVIVHEAQDLEGKYHTNPYVRLLFRGEHKKTKHIKKNKDPKWGDEFEFLCEKPPVIDKILFEVFSKPSTMEIHSKESLGYVEVNLADVVNKKRINERYTLIDSKNGRLQIECQWRPV